MSWCDMAYRRCLFLFGMYWSGCGGMVVPCEVVLPSYSFTCALYVHVGFLWSSRLSKNMHGLDKNECADDAI